MNADEAFERAWQRLVEKAPPEAITAALDALSQVTLVGATAFQRRLFDALWDASNRLRHKGGGAYTVGGRRITSWDGNGNPLVTEEVDEQ